MIWCVEDDPGIRDIEIYALSSTGFEARGFEDGHAFLAALESEQPDLVLLDVMLPGKDGVEILRAMKEDPALRHIPVIMATAKGSEFDKIQSLDIGADDYLVKPFGMMEMVSRVRAVLRRCRPPQQDILRIGGLELSPASHTAAADGNRISLTYKEFEILHLFMAHPDRAYSREELYETVWGMDFVGETRTVDMHIRTLRQKLGEYGPLIETVRNVGYILRSRP